MYSHTRYMAAIWLVLDKAKELTDLFDVVSLDGDPSNARAKHVYENLCFIEIGKVNHGSAEMEFPLKQPARP